jgi:predicted GNAT superfamily acetyltransferase
MIEIRACAGFEEFEGCVQLQLDTWGYDAREKLPRKGFQLASLIGGQVFGAFDHDLPLGPSGSQAAQMVGYAMAMAGIKAHVGGAPTPYLHSHMLAVLPAYRNQGLGGRLKRAQRLEALSRGITHMEWTFDPLEIKNSYLNLVKLGAIVYEYKENFYGVSQSLLQAGLPTDRLLALWQMDSPRVEAALAGRPQAAFKVETRIELPAAIYDWKASEQDHARALDVLLRNRTLFQAAFHQGLAVLGFRRDTEGNGIFELGYPQSA